MPGRHGTLLRFLPLPAFLLTLSMLFRKELHHRGSDSQSRPAASQPCDFPTGVNSAMCVTGDPQGQWSRCHCSPWSHSLPNRQPPIPYLLTATTLYRQVTIVPVALVTPHSAVSSTYQPLIRVGHPSLIPQGNGAWRPQKIRALGMGVFLPHQERHCLPAVPLP